ncbi:MAG: HPr family phosphocarrier protein [Spirochaetes bacterium]|nr:HPr family phosphocarrier protein [Spirochaetota bacterium]
MTLTTLLEVKNKNGLHTRPAGILCNIANRSKYSPLGVFMVHNGLRVDVKSILNVLTLGAVHGAKIILEIEGEEPEKTMMEEALKEISDFFEASFDVVAPDLEQPDGDF